MCGVEDWDWAECGVEDFFKTLPLAFLNALNSPGLRLFLGSVFIDGRAAFICGKNSHSDGCSVQRISKYFIPIVV